MSEPWDADILFRCALHDVEIPTNAYYDHCNEFHDGNLITVMIVRREEADE